MSMVVSEQKILNEKDNNDSHQIEIEYYKGHQFSKDLLSEIRALQEKNNWYNFFSLVLDWLLIVMAIVITQLYSNIIVYILSIILIGGRMRGLDNLMHESSHKMLFKNKTLNKWIASIFIALPVTTNYNLYCSSHYKHHKYLWTDQDPDTSELKQFGLGSNSITKRQFVLRYIFGSFLIKHIIKNIIDCITRLVSKDQQTNFEYFIKLSGWIIILSVSVLFNFWQELLLFWFVPLVTVFPIIRFWSDLADHSGLEDSNPFHSSRNNYGSWLERLILTPHHDNYHIVHHLFPSIPHFNLKKAHIILLKHPEYAKASHCTGFFNTFLPGFKSVISDVVKKMNKNRY
ncbi:fatty acid desaturase family protein [Paenibacillus mendelii]|uniref:Fatty acid desaturase n=1 Tax=Paenibacillus mendelii TaxID=206163 RepID=A0ABV6JA15_9BACL|nr:fatty acid desaturase family protein [Paenibacillus mendelii]MCQ6562056.1 fatty acid desaturase family protein [Paenibacillus mendelii]